MHIAAGEEKFSAVPDRIFTPNRLFSIKNVKSCIDGGAIFVYTKDRNLSGAGSPIFYKGIGEHI